jgi:hypothetical protein
MPSLIGNKPNQVPSNGDLGTLAFQDANAVNITGGSINGNIATTGLNIDSNTLVVDAVNNRVGIGTASPAQALNVSGNGVFSTGWVSVSGGGNGLRVDGVIIGDRDQDNNITRIGGSDNTMLLRTASTERMRIDSSGNVGIGLTPTARNNTRLQIVDGIGFPATQVASSDANTLDDYEEGTFTPNFTGSGSNPTVTYADRVGTYVKIGRVVYYAIYIQTTAASGGSGNLGVSGLPFNLAVDGDTNATFVFNFGASPPLAPFAQNTNLLLYTSLSSNLFSPVSSLTSTGNVFFRAAGFYYV